MVVLENNIEFEFLLIPLTREAFAQLTNTSNDTLMDEVVDTITNDENQSVENNNTEVETNIEDLFN